MILSFREIGSGTGLVGLSIAALLMEEEEKELLLMEEEEKELLQQQQQGKGGKPSVQDIVITDRATNLDLIRKNAIANGLSSTSSINLKICEYDWTSDDLCDLGEVPYDVIVGTDAAYCEELYQPVIKALCHVAGPNSIILLGVTRTDTRPPFFKRLRQAGFDYCLIRCHDSTGEGEESRGFALFSVVRRC